jgi:hypothetical protein
MTVRTLTRCPSALEESPRDSRIPVSFALARVITELVEMEYRRPPGSLHPGHFALVVDYATAFALQLVRGFRNVHIPWSTRFRPPQRSAVSRGKRR